MRQSLCETTTNDPGLRHGERSAGVFTRDGGHVNNLKGRINDEQ
jgi:hypothetical protein